MCFCRCKYSTGEESAVDKMKIEPVMIEGWEWQKATKSVTYSTKILLNTVTISEVNLTAIDSLFT